MGNAGTPPLTRFFGPEKNVLKEICPLGRVLVLKPEFFISKVNFLSNLISSIVSRTTVNMLQSFQI